MQKRASETNGYGRLTDLEWASDKTGRDRTMAVGSRECWSIPVNDTYVQVKSNESAYKGVISCVSTTEFDREEMSVCLALRATQEAAGWFTLRANCL